MLKSNERLPGRMGEPNSCPIPQSGVEGLFQIICHAILGHEWKLSGADRDAGNTKEK